MESKFQQYHGFGLFLPTIWVISLGVGTLVFTRYILTDSYIIALAMVGYGIFCVVQVIRFIIRREWVTLLSYAAPAVVLILLPIYGARLNRVADIVEIKMFREKFTTCIQQGVKVGTVDIFAICDRRTDSLFMTARFIVYDSSGQIASPPNERSPEWRQTIGSVGFTPFDVRDSITIPLGGHFYEVDFFET
jgi:hypothetical protein